jgi:predicted component of type VI protein secretion system
MICPNCGQTTIDTENCSHCGATLGVARNADGGDPGAGPDYFLYGAADSVMNIYGAGESSVPSHPTITPAASASTGHLVVHIDADYWGGSTERVVPLDGHEVTIGRSPGCTIPLEHDFLVSRHHAIIRYRDTGYVIIDLGSSNGITVNNEQIATECPLHEGDRIRIGDCEIIYSMAPAPEHTASVSPAIPEIGALDVADADTPRSLEAAPVLSQAPTMPSATNAGYFGDVGQGSAGPNGAITINPAEADWAEPASISPATEPDQLEIIPDKTTAFPPGPDLDALQAQLTGMVSQLRQQAETAGREVERLKAEIAAASATLSTLIEIQGKLALEGPDLATLLQVTERTVESPRHLDNVIEFATHATEIGVALRTLQDIRSNSGLIAAIESLRTRLAALG